MKTYRKSQITRRLSRRLFLEEALLTVAAVSTGPSRVLLAADRVKQSKNPNERLSVAAIGSDNERFIESPASNTMLMRDYRKPFVVPKENDI
jgi:hypothetical protein